MTNGPDTYLGATLGSPVVTEPMAFPRGCPALLKALFSLREGDVRGTHCAFLVDSGRDRLTPKAIGRQVDFLRERLGMPIVYVGQPRGQHDIPRLMTLNIPTVVPQKCVSLPFLALQVRNAGPRRPVGRNRFAGCEQLIVLAALHARIAKDFGRAELTDLLPYSGTAVWMALNTLEELGLCAVSGGTGAVPARYTFTRQGRDLWDAALPYFIRPFTRTVGLAQPPPPPAVLAGENLLSERTELAPPKGRATYAVWGKAFRDPPAADLLPERDAPCVLQLWKYPPTLLGDNTIDTLSLILSLKDSPDERVQGECDRLLRRFPW